MMDRGPSLWSEISGIAASAGSVEERAQACPTSLRRVVPYAAAWIAQGGRSRA
jgi:hypothetical protein